jgi:hypothetical protein
MISVLNFKSFNKGAIKGFFDLRYHGLTIKGCRLMNGNSALWFSFPQVKGEENGEVKYYDQMFLTALEREHVRNLVLLDRQSQGHLDQPKQKRPSKPKRASSKPDDLSDYYTKDDDIGF